MLAWILIALLLAATLWAVQWAAKQPRVHSIWGEPSEKPITRNYGRCTTGNPSRLDLYVFKDKMTRIGINGFGRMGRLAFRAVWDCPDVSIVHVNEIKGGAATAAHLLEFDSVHGRWTRPTTVATDHFTVDGRKSPLRMARNRMMCRGTQTALISSSNAAANS